MKIYGIRNCDTVKKARKWLDEAGIAYTFHDFKRDGLNDKHLSQWEAAVGWEALVNRRGTTWRKLPEEDRDNIAAETAHHIMLNNPSIIKRPVVEHANGIHVGFNADEWSNIFQQN